MKLDIAGASTEAMLRLRDSYHETVGAMRAARASGLWAGPGMDAAEAHLRHIGADVLPKVAAELERRCHENS